MSWNSTPPERPVNSVEWRVGAGDLGVVMEHSKRVREGGAEAKTGTGSERSDVPVPVFAAADVAGNGDRHLEDSEPVPVPSAQPFSYTL